MTIVRFMALGTRNDGQEIREAITRSAERKELHWDWNELQEDRKLCQERREPQRDLREAARGH